MKRYIFLSRINRGILTEIFAYSLQGINVDHVVLVMTLCSTIGRSITRICSLDLLRMSRSWNAVADAAEVLPNYDFRLGNTSINDVVRRSGFYIINTLLYIIKRCSELQSRYRTFNQHQFWWNVCLIKQIKYNTSYLFNSLDNIVWCHTIAMAFGCSSCFYIDCIH